jgi:hypothetical protein
MNSQIVNEEIKKVIWPKLKAQNFTYSIERTIWRFSPEIIEVIDFESFSEYNAYLVGCTPFSFQVNVGIYYKSVEKTPWFTDVPLSTPAEYHCQARSHLLKTLDQTDLFFSHKKLNFGNQILSLFSRKKNKVDKKTIWYVKDDGSNLTEVVNDVSKRIEIAALPWFELYGNIDKVIELHEKADPVAESFLDPRDSVVRAETMSALYLSKGKIDAAVNEYERIKKTPVDEKNHKLKQIIEERIKLIRARAQNQSH